MRSTGNRADPPGPYAGLSFVASRHGYRSGGLQLRVNRETEQPTFDPEFVDDIEMGLKTTFDLAGMTTRFNAAYFYQKYEDIQRTLSFIPPGQTALTTVVLNAGKATIQGGEAELTIIPFDALELSAFVGYTDAQDDEFDNPGIAGQPASLTSNEFAMVPDLSAGATVTYTLPLSTEVGDVSLQLNWYTQSDWYTKSTNRSCAKGGDCGCSIRRSAARM